MGKCVNVVALVLLLFLITLFTGCSSSCSTETLLTADRLYSRTLRSPNYPSNYSNNQECVWRIRAESWRFTVRLYVDDIRLEYDHDCTFDSLSFYDGGLGSNDNLLAKLCGISGLRRYFYSSGREILVKFKSDSSDTFRGFSLLYKAVQISTTVPTTITTTTSDNLSCWTERTLTASSFNNGTLVSTNYPRNYPNNQECVWRIRAESWRFTVRLYVADIRLESVTDCRFDSLSFYDGGLASNDNLLAKLCGTSGLDSYFYSSGREILVKFKSDSSDTYRGFRLMYKAVRNTTTTTTTPDHNWPSGDDSTELFAAVPAVGAVATLLVAIAVVICYHPKSKHQASGHSDTAPRVTTPTPTATASVPRAGANNNNSSSNSRSQQQGVYILPANQPSTRPAGVVAGRGHTNAAYSPAAVEPLPHSFQPLPSLSPSAPPLPDVTIPRQTADVAMSPPSYNEVMMMEEGTQPPSYEEVGGADTLVMTSSDDAAVRNNSSRHDD